MKTCVVIPTYNESKTIGDIIKRILAQNLEVVVIDDGSKDHTAKIAQEKGAAVIRNLRNEGKGASLIKGFDYALKENFDAVITMDGDGQHLPEYASSFIEEAKRCPGTLLIGNRMLNPQGMPFIRRLTNSFMSWFLSLIIGQKIADTQCGFRLIKKEILSKLQLKASRYEIETEILIRSSRLGYRIKSIPIDTIYQGQKSEINPLTDTLRFIGFVIRELFKK